MTETTSKGFTMHTRTSAPEGSAELLARSAAEYGAIPSLHAILAEAPAALAAYRQLWALMATSSLTEAESQVVYMTSNYENDCRYCMAGHSVGGRQAGLTDAQLRALRSGEALDDERLEALHRFTSRVVTARGWVGEDETERFLGAGFTRAQVLEVVAHVATKVISNYTNHLADTPLDPFMKDTVWGPPGEDAA